MKQVTLATLIVAFAIGPALAQSCDSRAVGKDGRPLAGAAKTSFLAKCKREACAPKAVDGYSRRQLFANAAIAASPVGSWLCVGVRSSRQP